MPIKKIYLFVCLGLGLLILACAGSRPVLSDLDNTVSLRAARPAEVSPAAGSPKPYRYTNTEGNFSLNLPPGWTAGQARPTPFGHLYLFNPAQLGANDISVLVAQPNITSGEALLAYICPDCRADSLVIEPAVLGGQPAQQIRFTGQNTPDLAWYLVEHNGRVLVFTIHRSDADLYAEILQSLQFEK